MIQSSPLVANPVDLFGEGAREIGMGNAFTAVADDPFAAYYNVAGLIQIRRTTAAVGFQLGDVSLGDPDLCADPDGVGCSEPFYYTEGGALTVQQKRYGYDQPLGLSLGLALPLAHGVSLGMSAYLPIDVRYDADGRVSGVGVRLARFQTLDPYLPDYVLYRNRAQRFAVYSGIGIEILPGLAGGIGVTMMAGSRLLVDFKGTVHVSEGPAGDDGEPTTEVILETAPQISMDLATQSTPTLGLLWDVGTTFPGMAHWTVGLSYRGESRMTAQADIEADLAMIAETDTDSGPASYGTTLDDIGTDVVGFFTPRQLTLGFSTQLATRYRLSADLEWVDWSAFVPAMAALPESVQSILGIDVLVTPGRTVDTTMFHDIVVPRVGVEARLGPVDSHARLRTLDLYLRAGAAFERNPFSRQTLETNLLNSDRVVGALGAGIVGHNPMAVDRALPVSLDVSLQCHYLIPTVHEKTLEPGDLPPDGYPLGGSYVSRGTAVQAAMTLQLGF